MAEFFAWHRLNIQDISVLIVLTLPRQRRGGSDRGLIDLGVDVAGAGAVDIQRRGDGWGTRGRSTVGRGSGGSASPGIWDCDGLLLSSVPG